MLVYWSNDLTGASPRTMARPNDPISDRGHDMDEAEEGDEADVRDEDEEGHEAEEGDEGEEGHEADY